MALSNPPAPNGACPGLKLLLVEDDVDDVALIVELMRARRPVSDYRWAADGEEALRTLDAGGFQPDLILLDLNMPRMGGLEFLSEVRKLPEHATTPVVILTTSARVGDVREALRRAAAGYIVKPDSALELENRLHGAVEKLIGAA
jgi:CheY-like chemotaxis protein